jgi:hypothetical protein
MYLKKHQSIWMFFNAFGRICIVLHCIGSIFQCIFMYIYIYIYIYILLIDLVLDNLSVSKCIYYVFECI